MKEWLYECARRTGCDAETVEKVVACFLQLAADTGPGGCAPALGGAGAPVAAHGAGLLEALQLRVGCMYLSDLHIPSNLPLIHSALRKIEPNSYALAEWNDAVCYITGQNASFANQGDAANYLLDWLA